MSGSANRKDYGIGKQFYGNGKVSPANEACVLFLCFKRMSLKPPKHGFLRNDVL